MASTVEYWMNFPVPVHDEVFKDGGLHEVQKDTVDIEREFPTNVCTVSAVQN